MRIPLFLLLLTVAPSSRGRGQGLPRARPEDIGLSSASLAQIRPALQAQVDSGKVAGFLAIVARHGKVGYLESIGMLDLGHGTPMRPDAIFAICSMSKPVTAVAVLQLYDRGKLKLDDPVSQYIPALSGVKVYASGPAANPSVRAPDRPITLADLLTHTAGLTYGFFGNTPVDTLYQRANLFLSTRTLAEFVDTLSRLPLLFSPGSAWNYSLGIDVLGRVVEVASGKSFDRYLEEELFAPLGMRDTGFHYRPGTEARLATIYGRGPDGKLVVVQDFCSDPSPGSKWLSGGGGLLSTPADYLRFAQMLLNGGELEGKRILRRETVALMLKNELPPAVGRIPKDALAQSGYGQGFGGAVLVDSALTGLPGAPGIYRWWGYAETYFWIDPQRDLIAMLWSQFLPGNPTVPLEFQRLVYAAIKAP
ncbi:MAG TPA: serine hydrolase domain-containing protein [Gemmatimonadales bacterium]|nr:serine hydrolase domain-containing protein [Gemmatimonadales bacterium]